MRRALLLLPVAFLLANCGGGGEKSYTEQADAICKKYTKETSALGTPKSITELGALVDKTLPILDRARTELAALKPPPDKRALAKQWLAQFDKLRADVRDIRDKAKAGDVAGVGTVAQRAQQDNAKANELGTRLGFKVCNKS